MNRELRLAALSFSLVVGLGGAAAGEEKARVEVEANQKAEQKEFKPIKDPIGLQISEFRKETGQKFTDGKFEELEKLAAELRASKETFANGLWKISQFYIAIACSRQEPDGVWLRNERLHKDWIDAKPESVTAKVAYGRFLTEYAWRARGSGFSGTVTEEGWKLFEERLASASDVLRDATKSPEKDPMLGRAFLTVALGQGWPKAVYDTMMEKLHGEEPAFWDYDVARAMSLMPRWYGDEGEWEAFAEEAAARPKGLGDETYARIIMDQRGYYDNIFQETKASWAKTRKGLEILRQKFPDSLELVNETALLAALGQDRALSKEMFEKMGDSYVSSFWRSAARFNRFRVWAETGKWRK